MARAFTATAGGVCSRCGSDHYVAAHHVVARVDAGPDHPLNLEALLRKLPRDGAPMLTDDERDQMQELFDRAMEAGPADAALNRLIYCHVLTRVTDGDLNLALEAFSDPGTGEAATRELESLDDDERTELAPSLAVMYMWRTCRNLGYDPDGLGGDHLAIVAPMFLGPKFEQLGAWPDADAQ